MKDSTGLLSMGSGSAARALLLAHLIASPLLFSALTLESFEYSKVAVLVLTALALAALGLASLLQRFAAGQVFDWPRLDPLSWGMLLFLLSAIVSTLCSVSPRLSLRGEPNSLHGLLTITGFLVVYFATRLVIRGETDARRLLGAVVIATAGASVYALIQAAGGDAFAWDGASQVGHYVRPLATLGHPNFLAAYLVMGVPLAGYFLIRAHGQNRGWPTGFFGSIVFLSCLATFLTMTRAAWLALAFVGGVGVTALVFRAGKSRLVRHGALIVGLMAVAAGICVISLPGLRQALVAFGEGALRSSTLESRWRLWQAALNLFAAHPLVGTGLDTFHVMFGSVRSPLFNLCEWNTTPLRPHSLPLDILTQQGLLGGLAALVILFGLGQSIVRAWRRRDADRTLVAALTLACGAFFIQGLFSFTVAGTGTLFVTLAALLSRLGGVESLSHAENTHEFPTGVTLGVGLVIVSMMVNLVVLTAPVSGIGMFGQILVVATIAGAARLVYRDEDGSTSMRTSAGESIIARTSWLRPAQACVWGAAIVLMYVWVVGPFRAEWAARRGENLRGDNIEAALKEYRRAVEIAPGNHTYWKKLADGYRQAAARCGDADQRAGLLSEARAACARSLDLIPMDAERHGQLARILTDLARLERARPEHALREYDRALALDPNNAYLLADAANAALTMSRVGRALDYAERGVARYPYFAMLRAHVGYVALEQNRPRAAVRWIAESLMCSWYGEEASKAFARQMLVVAIDRMNAAQP